MRAPVLVTHNKAMTGYNIPGKASKHLMAPLLLLLALSTGGVAASDIDSAIKTVVDGNAPELIATYKQFHQNPELGFQEFETAATIAAHLKNLCEVKGRTTSGPLGR